MVGRCQCFGSWCVVLRHPSTACSCVYVNMGLCRVWLCSLQALAAAMVIHQLQADKHHLLNSQAGCRAAAASPQLANVAAAWFSFYLLISKESITRQSAAWWHINLCCCSKGYCKCDCGCLTAQPSCCWTQVNSRLLLVLGHPCSIQIKFDTFHGVHVLSIAQQSCIVCLLAVLSKRWCTSIKALHGSQQGWPELSTISMNSAYEASFCDYI